MNISQISIPISIKKTDPRSKNEAQLGKVISKTGKEIQVLIKDKVYKIEPGNANQIKTGDMIQVFFGKDLPQEVSSEVLNKIGAKLIDVYSLSLPFKTSQDLETLINKMPQHEKMLFARISNQISSLAESILRDDFNLEVKETVEKSKNAFDLYDPRLPFNRRLIELSLKAKSMGESWDQIPDKIKREIIKEFVLYDLKKATTAESESSAEKNGAIDKLFTDETVKKQGTVNKAATVMKSEAAVSVAATQIPKEFKAEQTISTFDKKTLFNPVPSQTSETDQLPVNKRDVTVSNTDDTMVPKALSKEIHVEGQNTSQMGTLMKSAEIDNSEATQRLYQSAVKIQNNAYTQTDSASKEEIIKQTVNELKDLLKELLSKPVTIEKNHEKLSQITNEYKDTLSFSHSVQNNSQREDTSLSSVMDDLIQKREFNHDDKNILTILNRLVKSGNENNIDFDSIKINKDLFANIINGKLTFEEVKNDPMMQFEVKNLMRQLNTLGIAPKESATIANDILNIAVRSFKDYQISQKVFPNSLKNYLKMKLPQTIMGNNIQQSSEKTLISRIQSFSQKAYVIVKDFVHKLISSSNETAVLKNTDQPVEKTEQPEKVPSTGIRFTTSEKEFSQNSTEEVKSFNRFADSQIPLKQPKSFGTELSPSEKKAIITSLEESNSLNERGKSIINMKNTLEVRENELNPDPKKNIPVEDKTTLSKSSVSEEKLTGLPIPEKNEINSEKLLKMLNITSDKNEYNQVYSALLNFNDQNFTVDFQKQSVQNTGYEKTEMYRVYIETETQRFGNVFIDTIVTGENLDIYIYAGQEHAREFTNHSSVLTKRIKETDYTLRSLLIKEKVNHDDILKHKVKLYTNTKNDGGFFELA
ncbi:MAG TPA: hypothetical protein PK466_01420 [Thermotogota bacterium]|nr:hypothetical protein [Thermotogota bacterium]